MTNLFKELKKGTSQSIIYLYDISNSGQYKYTVKVDTYNYEEVKEMINNISCESDLTTFLDNVQSLKINGKIKTTNLNEFDTFGKTKIY